MTQKDVVESYVRQQAIVKQLLIAIRSNVAGDVAKYTAILALEIFKNHSLTDVKSCGVIDESIKIFLESEPSVPKIASLELGDDELEE